MLMIAGNPGHSALIIHWWFAFSFEVLVTLGGQNKWGLIDAFSDRSSHLSVIQETNDWFSVRQIQSWRAFLFKAVSVILILAQTDSSRLMSG
jgi:hypothetical protein